MYLVKNLENEIILHFSHRKRPCICTEKRHISTSQVFTFFIMKWGWSMWYILHFYYFTNLCFIILTIPMVHFSYLFIYSFYFIFYIRLSTAAFVFTLHLRVIYYKCFLFAFLDKDQKAIIVLRNGLSKKIVKETNIFKKEINTKEMLCYLTKINI